MNLMWELLQQRRISSVSDSVSDVQVDVRDLVPRVRELERQVEGLSLAVVALAELLEERHGISKKLIEEKIQEIDLRDGAAAGKRRSAKRCQACDRPNSAMQINCIYCSAPLPSDPFPLERGDSDTRQ